MMPIIFKYTIKILLIILTKLFTIFYQFLLISFFLSLLPSYITYFYQLSLILSINQYQLSSPTSSYFFIQLKIIFLNLLQSSPKSFLQFYSFIYQVFLEHLPCIQQQAHTSLLRDSFIHPGISFPRVKAELHSSSPFLGGANSSAGTFA